MAVPLLIDTDMGVDDAVAVSLALASDALDVRAVVGVGGNVELDQVMVNIGRLLAALNPPVRPIVGRGLDQAESDLPDAREVFGGDGLGETNLPPDTSLDAVDFRTVYREAIEAAGGELVVQAIGPLTNLAAILSESPELASAIKQVVIVGGAVWTKGNVDDVVEFNFRRDPVAAAKVLGSGLPITVIPLDVTNLVTMDESHVAHLAASGYRTGEVLARMLGHCLESDADPGYGRTFIHDALATGNLLWPKLFLKTRMRLDVVTTGQERGRSRPGLGGDKSKQVGLLTAINSVDFLENVLESLCHEAFVV